MIRYPVLPPEANGKKPVSPVSAPMSDSASVPESLPSPDTYPVSLPVVSFPGGFQEPQDNSITAIKNIAKNGTPLLTIRFPPFLFRILSLQKTIPDPADNFPLFLIESLKKPESNRRLYNFQISFSVLLYQLYQIIIQTAIAIVDKNIAYSDFFG